MPIEEYVIDKNIQVLCVTAASFPAGVQTAHKKLHSLVHSTLGRIFYGISFPDKNGNIIYKAATEERYDDEAMSLNLETFVIRKGVYISEVLADWDKDEPSVGRTFQKLLSDPRIDKNGYCLEIYLNDRDMRCLVPLDPSYSQREQRHDKSKTSR